MNPRVYYVVYTVVSVAEESLNDHCGSGKNHVWLLWALHMIGCPQQPIMCGCCGRKDSVGGLEKRLSRTNRTNNRDHVEKHILSRICLIIVPRLRL